MFLPYILKYALRMGLGGDGYAYGLDDVDKSTLTPKTH